MRSLAKARRPRAPNMYKFTSFSLGGTPTLSPDPWFKTCHLHNLDRSHTSPLFVPEPVRMPLPSPGHRSSRNALTLEVGLATNKESIWLENAWCSEVQPDSPGSLFPCRALVVVMEGMLEMLCLKLDMALCRAASHRRANFPLAVSPDDCCFSTVRKVPRLFRSLISLSTKPSALTRRLAQRCTGAYLGLLRCSYLYCEPGCTCPAPRTCRCFCAGWIPPAK